MAIDSATSNLSMRRRSRCRDLSFRTRVCVGLKRGADDMANLRAPAAFGISNAEVIL